MNKKIAIIIPAFKPDQRLVALINELSTNQTTQNLPILVVNDGSGDEFLPVFNEVQPLAIVLTHEVNKGKGAALKTAFKHIRTQMADIIAAITIDADGQHTVNDTMRCIQAFYEHQAINPIVLGCRQFDGNVPLRSKFGNLMTRDVLAMSTGLDISDTQTGLRVIPTVYFEGIEQLEGERYELEMQTLVYAKDLGVKFIEVPIETIYLEDNASSHFNPLLDSIRIYAIFFKYLLSSVASFLLDIGIFTIIVNLIKNHSLNTIMIASYSARAISSLFNFFVNKKVVFKQGDPGSKLKYFSLVIAQISLSGLLVSVCTRIFSSWNVAWVKTMVDFVLFLVSYQIQKHFVFTNKKVKNEEE